MAHIDVSNVVRTMDEMIPVLYISYDGMTDPLGQSQVLPYLVELTKKGYAFQVISFEKKARFKSHNTHIQSICDRAGIQWHPLSYTKKPPLLSTIYDVQRMKRLAHQLHKKHHFEIIHCRSYLSALVGLGMKKKFATKFLFDMRGFYADERVDGAIWSLKNPLFKRVYTYFKRKEVAFFKQSDYTISLTNNGQQEIESWSVFHENPPRIQVIPCCVDLNLFNPESIQKAEQDSLRQRLGIMDGDSVLGYVGSIGTWYMLPEMLDFFKVYQTQNLHAKFLFVTSEQPENILNLAQQKGILAESIIITSCLHKEVPLYVSLFDLSIFFIRPTYSKKASSPTKQGEIMAMGIPLVCNAGVGDTDYVVNQYAAGSVIMEFNEREYIKKLTELTTVFNKQHTIEGAHVFYGLEVGVKYYLKVYKQLTN
jgi:glycosyltransferase involved in cell wall biosynthesis